MQLDLSDVHDWLHDQAEEAFERGDVGMLLCSMGSSACLSFVIRNIKPLKEALAHAWTANNVNNSWLDVYSAYYLFHGCDREKLRAVGDSLPPGDTFTLYRGVAGNGVRRRINGLCWTDDLDCACWFAVRFPFLKHPAVFTATVAADDILYYTNDRNEREFVTGAVRPVRLRLSIDEIRQRAERRTAQQHAKSMANIAAMLAKHEAAA